MAGNKPARFILFQGWRHAIAGFETVSAPWMETASGRQVARVCDLSPHIEIDGVMQPAPAPRFSRTECATPSQPRAEGVDTESVLVESGFSLDEIEQLRKLDVIV